MIEHIEFVSLLAFAGALAAFLVLTFSKGDPGLRNACVVLISISVMTNKVPTILHLVILYVVIVLIFVGNRLRKRGDL